MNFTYCPKRFLPSGPNLDKTNFDKTFNFDKTSNFYKDFNFDNTFNFDKTKLR